ncbi:hypothetical protein ASY01nite_17650 [Acetobacter syzygii]|nr:hypothetical protein Absy_001_001 [Acetobacter syzygii]GBR64826.1 prophage integrase [Acetobacter syzygii NRIC 0483]GEL56699.1 hypothetical protein ASY01nite_17650 [Acetobacter syzygii]
MTLDIHGPHGITGCTETFSLKEDGWTTIGIVARYTKKIPDTYREEIRAWWGLESGTDLARI